MLLYIPLWKPTEISIRIKSIRVIRIFGPPNVIIVCWLLPCLQFFLFFHIHTNITSLSFVWRQEYQHMCHALLLISCIGNFELSDVHRSKIVVSPSVRFCFANTNETNVRCVKFRSLVSSYAWESFIWYNLQLWPCCDHAYTSRQQKYSNILFASCFLINCSAG